MTNPFQVLGVPETADDAEIKKAYLRKVREFPPDRAPQQFQVVREAFEAVQTRRDRLRYRLFHTELPTPAMLLEPSSQDAGSRRPGLELLQRTLDRTLADETG